MSNLFKSPDGERLAARLCEQSFADFVFFAIPAPRRWNARSRSRASYHVAKGHPERYRIITFEGAFHGRTLATLAATGSAKYLEGFGPPLDGFDQVPLGDLEAVKKAIGPAHRRHPDRAGAGRGRRARGAAVPSSRRCASSATRTACC